MKYLKFLLLGLGILLVSVLAIIAGDFLLFRGFTPSIDGDRSIASLEEIELGGVKQWLLIRGVNRDKPVVLFLHGGPGMPAMFLAHAWQSNMERDFVMVHWDRRGAGKSYGAALDGQGLTVSQTLADTVELTRLLLERFERERIYLLGHSWGSYLGLLAVREHPEYYAAFVGTGQVTGDPARITAARRDFLVNAAEQEADDEAAQRFADPDYRINEDDLFRFGVQLRGARSYLPLVLTGFSAREYTFSDAMNVRKGSWHVGGNMRYDVTPHPDEGEIGAVDVPVVMLLGRYDYNTPSALAVEYLDRLQTPLRRVAWFEESAHFPFLEEPERFHEEFLALHLAVSEFQAAGED